MKMKWKIQKNVFHLYWIWQKTRKILKSRNSVMKWNLISMLIHSDVYFDGFCSRIEIQFRNFLLCCWMNYEFNKFFEQINRIMFVKDRWEFNTYLKIETAKQFLKITSLMFPWCLRINKVFFIKILWWKWTYTKAQHFLEGFSWFVFVLCWWWNSI